jgi:hypothetical protein
MANARAYCNGACKTDEKPASSLPLSHAPTATHKSTRRAATPPAAALQGPAPQAARFKEVWTRFDSGERSSRVPTATQPRLVQASTENEKAAHRGASNVRHQALPAEAPEALRHRTTSPLRLTPSASQTGAFRTAACASARPARCFHLRS